MSDENNKRKPTESALKVNEGVDQPDQINVNAAKKFKRRKGIKYTVDQFVEGIINGDRTILGQAITLIESSLPEHNAVAHDIIEMCLPYARKSIRVGITGVPGVGKSTFIESLGVQITESGRKLAVLAVDPSSERSKGSILGDKTRMEKLSSDPNAFIRPSPSAGSLGGVARKTRETIVLCEAAGFDTIFIETVGVGQSEVAVHSMVDFFLLLMLAGAGDELQGIKRGIMEMADAIAITKSDGDNVKTASMAQAQYQSALHLFPPKESSWIPKVLTCSSLHNLGIDKVWETILEYVDFTKSNQYFFNRRKEQSKYWMHEAIREVLRNNFYQNPELKDIIPQFEENVLNAKMNPFLAAKKLLQLYFNK